jgi:hypothetical protein
MRLYHGGIEPVFKPTIIESQRLLDFGRGFYLTSNQEQAERWSVIKQNRSGSNSIATVSVYDFDEQILTHSKYDVKVFDNANEEWLDFITANRKSNTNHSYEIVKGAVANDNLYSTLVLFEAGILTKSETIVRLKTHKLFDQISFHNLNVMSELLFIKSYQTKTQ